MLRPEISDSIRESRVSHASRAFALAYESDYTRVTSHTQNTTHIHYIYYILCIDKSSAHVTMHALSIVHSAKWNDLLPWVINIKVSARSQSPVCCAAHRQSDYFNYPLLHALYCVCLCVCVWLRVHCNCTTINYRITHTHSAHFARRRRRLFTSTMTTLFTLCATSSLHVAHVSCSRVRCGEECVHTCHCRCRCAALVVVVVGIIGRFRHRVCSSALAPISHSTPSPPLPSLLARLLVRALIELLRRRGALIVHVSARALSNDPSDDKLTIFNGTLLASNCSDTRAPN